MKIRASYLAFLLALSALTIFFVWPIYQDTYLFVTAGVALFVGAGIGALQVARKTSFITTALATLLAFVLLALPLSNPRALGNTSTLLPGLIDALVGPVEAWKQIITIDLPIGTYHALLSPVLVLYLLTGVLFGWLLLSKTSKYWLASIPVLAIVIFAFSFGLTTVPGDFQFLGVKLPIETPFVTGGTLFVLLVVYLNWGAKATRREALVVRKESLGITKNLITRKLRRSALSVGVVLVSVALVTASMQFAGVTSNRTVLRTGIEKAKDLQKQVSPLSTYRSFFSDPNKLSTELLSYTPSEDVSRIRIATMPYFDGESFTVAPSTVAAFDDNVFFSRLPSELPSTGGGRRGSIEIQVGQLNSIWLPAVSGLKRITFSGENALVLSDALFVNRNTGTAAIIPEVEDGEEAVVAENSNQSNYLVDFETGDAVDTAQPLPTSNQIAEDVIPEQIKTWLGLQNIKVTTGDDLLALAKLLRDRGYLSHGLETPVASEEQSSTWLSLVDGLRFEKSTSGHNMSRIDKMFGDLLEQQTSVGPRGNLVATAGDDEQFATAIALLAAAQGFEARVVIGFRTAAAEEVDGVPNCDEASGQGICTGANLAAWVEVKTAGGGWMTIDATPQFDKRMSVDTPPPGLPKNPSESGEDAAGVLPPGKSVPSNNAGDVLNECEVDLLAQIRCFVESAWNFVVLYIWPLIQLLLVVGIFAGPFALILLMKRRRLRGRREHPSDFARIVGAWEEYVDLTVDFGAQMPRNKTRLEIARAADNPEILKLAELANEMAYGSSEFESVDINQDELQDNVELTWAIYDEELKRLTADLKPLKKLQGKLSLRSFIRGAQPREQLRKITSTFNFNKDGKVSDGSGLDAVLKIARKQLLSVWPKK
jgi:hypothetical protein